MVYNWDVEIDKQVRDFGYHAPIPILYKCPVCDVQFPISNEQCNGEKEIVCPHGHRSIKQLNEPWKKPTTLSKGERTK